MEPINRANLSKTLWEKLNEFLLSLNSVESIEQLNYLVLNEISAIIPFDNSGVLIELGRDFKPEIKESINLEKKWIDLFNTYFYETIAPPDYDKIVFSADHRQMKTQHEYYNEFLAPQNIKNVAGFAIFGRQNTPTHSVLLNRTKSEGMFRANDLIILKTIQPHISGYYRMLSVTECLRKLPVVAPELDPDNRLLSGRESEITCLLLQRLKPVDIAKELKISILTVRKHIQNIYQKLNVSDKQQLFRKIQQDYKNN
ncbi:MAG: response regulator transcription factor [Spirochaetes bacterium]|nr:response regulator transcription factor [Spirochaetota bacterium]